MQKKISKLKFRIVSKTLIPSIVSKLRFKNKLTCIENDKKNFYRSCGYWPDYDLPKTFNEKLCYLKFNYKNDLWKRVADKLELKEYLKEIGLGFLAVETLAGPFDDANKIDLSLLPVKFVLKTNHDSGSVFVCDKSSTNFNLVFVRLNESVKKKYDPAKNEWVYEDIKPCIFAEEFLHPSDGNDLMDYKFFFSKGKPLFLFVASNRSKDVRFNIKDFDYNDIPCLYIYPKNKNLPIDPPPYYSQMQKYATQIASHFDFVRVDMYSTTQGPKVGELTFFSQSGHGCFAPRKFDYAFGDELDISFALKGVE